MSGPAPERPGPGLTRGDRLLGLAAALAVLAVLELVRGSADWGPSEGVYVLSSRLLLGGDALYRELVASQPPWVYLFGAVPLSVHDGLGTVRLACGLLQVGCGLVAAEAVVRLTGRRALAVAATPLTLLTPWAVHQHGLLLPEQLGAPLLLDAALLASRPATARWAGVLAGVAVLAKLPFVLPAALILLASPACARALAWAGGALVVQAALFTLLFGPDLWRGVVVAQVQAGGGLDREIGSWVQGTWNLLPLLALAAVALVLRRGSLDAPLLRTVAAGAVGALLAATSIVKPGTGLNVLVPVEPLLLVLALAGAAWGLGRLRAGRGRALAAAGVAALGLLLLAQSVSTLVDPEDPRPFHRPLSESPGWKVVATRARMDRLVAAARRCPPGAVYVGPPLVAFLADRRVPADQPDAFIVSRAATHAQVLARVRAAAPRCG